MISDRKTYSCKVTTYRFPNGASSKTISFGGNTTYCVVGAWKSDTPDTIYIDRIEYDKGCSIGSNLEHGKGTVHMIQCALYSIHQLLPEIKTITLTDDSHIYCEEGSKKYKLSLAHEYILKYTQTWYQKQFHAKLPESVFQIFQDSLRVLDEPLSSYEFQITLSPYLEKYKNTYVLATSPRDFFKRLRDEYGSTYCHEVWFWIRDFLERGLRIKIFKEMWFIEVGDLVKPENFSMELTTNKRGGGRRTRRKRVFEDEYSPENGVGVYGKGF